MAISTPVNLGVNVATNAAAATLAVTTTTAAVGSGRVVIHYAWNGAATASSVSGGGLTWVIDKQTTGFAVVSAPAASGMATGAVTLTLSASATVGLAAATFLPGAALGATGYTDGTPAGAAGTGTTWLMGSVTTTDPGSIIFAAAWGDTTGGPSNTPTGTPLGTEIHDNFNSGFAGTIATEYHLPGTTGAFNLGGTWNFSRSVGAQLGIAYKPEAVAAGPVRLSGRPRTATLRSVR
jgi:hypothetical protein